MCIRELCKVGRVNKENTAKGQKVEAIRLSNVAGRKSGASGQDWTQIRNSMSGKPDEPPPKEHRNTPSSHADPAGRGGETEWDIPKVGCGSLITKESEGSRHELPVGASREGLPEAACAT